ncbi:hypothetical protein [Frisingicoccus sp.]|uniref:hypothetical protein n=1 Tax=Frisingicoccus sp. TaxID=1918627 RepID=UPI003AB48F85
MSLTHEDLQAISLLLNPIQDDIKQIHIDMQQMQDNMQKMHENIGSLSDRVDSIETTLENVTNKNISIIAEAHLDLSRKLDDALKVENEKELLLIRVNILEDDVKKIKSRIEQIA